MNLDGLRYEIAERCVCVRGLMLPVLVGLWGRSGSGGKKKMCASKEEPETLSSLQNQNTIIFFFFFSTKQTHFPKQKGAPMQGYLMK